MNIFPVQRYCFKLTTDEVNALKFISNIDCSFANNCEGCPLMIDVTKDDRKCIKNMIAGMLARKGVIEDD